MSNTPLVSLIECIDSYGLPTSIVLIPVPAETNFPIVPPQGESFLTINSWIGIFFYSAINFKIDAEIQSVA